MILIFAAITLAEPNIFFEIFLFLCNNCNNCNYNSNEINSHKCFFNTLVIHNSKILHFKNIELRIDSNKYRLDDSLR